MAPSKKTPLSESPGNAAGQADLVARYEQLRRDALRRPNHGGEGFGLTLFLRRGMTAWMQAWSECARPVEPVTRFQPSAGETIPGDVRSQITTLLADMILSVPLEVCS